MDPQIRKRMDETEKFRMKEKILRKIANKFEEKEQKKEELFHRKKIQHFIEKSQAMLKGLECKIISIINNRGNLLKGLQALSITDKTGIVKSLVEYVFEMPPHMKSFVEVNQEPKRYRYEKAQKKKIFDIEEFFQNKEKEKREKLKMKEEYIKRMFAKLEEKEQKTKEMRMDEKEKLRKKEIILRKIVNKFEEKEQKKEELFHRKKIQHFIEKSQAILKELECKILSIINNRGNLLKRLQALSITDKTGIVKTLVEYVFEMPPHMKSFVEVNQEPKG